MRPIGGKVSAVMGPNEEEQALCCGSSFFFMIFFIRGSSISDTLDMDGLCLFLC